MEACCSFKSIVGGSCLFDQHNKKRSTEIVPLLSCSKSIDNHKSLYGFQGVSNEAELILARTAVFSSPQNIGMMTVCPLHRSWLGLGWTRGTDRCRVPEEISKHKKVKGKCPKGERGMTKIFSQTILKKTGLLVHVGSGTSANSIFITCHLLIPIPS